VAASLVVFFLVAAVARGQFRANWILPVAALLLPAGALPTRRVLLGTGVAVALACSLAQTVAMRQPQLLGRVETALAPGGPHEFTVHAGRREEGVSRARSWSEQLSGYADRSAFARDVDRAWRTESATAAPPAWIVSDDYGLAMQLHWYLGHDAVRVAVPGDGMFHRTVHALLASGEPGPLLVLPVTRPATELWDALADLVPLAEVAHPATGTMLTLYRARLALAREGDPP
jgi:hypothetical protein